MDKYAHLIPWVSVFYKNSLLIRLVLALFEKNFCFGMQLQNNWYAISITDEEDDWVILEKINREINVKLNEREILFL